MRMPSLLAAFMLLGMMQVPALAQVSTATSQPAQEEDAWRRVRVPVDEGKISTLALCQGVFDAYGMDGKQLDFKDHKIPVDNFTSRLLLYGLEKSMSGKLAFHRKDGGKTFELTIKKGSISSGRRAAKRKLLQVLSRLTGEDLIARQYRLIVPEKMDGVKTLIILVHGLDNRPELFDDLATFLESKGHVCARFSYPNDDRLTDSAKELSKKIKELNKEHEGMSFVLIAHSMGGLLCRNMIEDPKLYVNQLKAVAFLGTPHQGSYLSAYRSVLDLRDNLKGGFTAKALLGTWRDGFGEAGHDLWPGSEYLIGMAKLSRNPRVRYLNILGNQAPFSRKALDRLTAHAKKLLEKKSWGRLVLPKAMEALSDLRELETDKGDCAVALVRGHLEGVPEKVLPLDHAALVKLKGILVPKQSPESHPAYQLLLGFLNQ